jgi:hypothetical protein
VCDLQWHEIELSEARLHVRRIKNGTPSVHPIRGDEMRALRKLRRENAAEAYVFVSERGGPSSPIGFHRLIQRLGEAAKMPFPIHPHMLRHACGYKLANDGHDTMRRVGVLMNSSVDDPEGQARLTAFVQELAQLGWTEGRNMRIDYRWAAGGMESPPIGFRVIRMVSSVTSIAIRLHSTSLGIYRFARPFSSKRTNLDLFPLLPQLTAIEVLA